MSRILELSADSQYLSKRPLEDKVQTLTSQFSSRYSEIIIKEAVHAVINFIQNAESNFQNQEKLNNDPYHLFNLTSEIIKNIDSIQYHKAKNIKELTSALISLEKTNIFFSSLPYTQLAEFQEESVAVTTQMITPLVKFVEGVIDSKRRFEDQKKKKSSEAISAFDKELKISLEHYEKTNNDIEKQITVVSILKNNFSKNQINKLKTVNELADYLIQVINEHSYLSKISNNALTKAKGDYVTDASSLVDNINSLEQYLSQRLDGLMNKKTTQEAIITFSEFKGQVKQSIIKLEDQLNNDNELGNCHSIAFKLKQDLSLMQLYDNETIGQLATYLISIFDKYKTYLPTTTKTQLEKSLSKIKTIITQGTVL
jgi:hypothetical protein